MAAGLGFKDFQTGEVLTAADVDGYLMQGIWVFDDAAARDAAVTSPQEGNACYLKDTNEVLTYSGSVWVAVGGGSPLTTKGDLYTFSTVDARLAVGANDTVLTADSSEATGLRWATPAGGGGKVLQVVQGTLTGDSLTTSTSYSDTGLSVTITPSSVSSKVLIFVNHYSEHYQTTGSTTGIVASIITLRDATNISQGSAGANQWNIGMGGASGALNITHPFAFSTLDSPATTSATTYKTQFKVQSGTTLYANYTGRFSLSTIVAMEIGA